MDKIIAFQKHCQALNDSVTWLKKYGSVYHGGGGGIGKFFSFNINKCQIYHQPNNGDTNYHEIPAELKGFLEKVILYKLPELCNTAIDNMKKQKIILAEKAKKTCEDVLNTIESSTSHDHH